MATHKNIPDNLVSTSLRPGLEIMLRITDLAFGGNGVGRIDGLACFVPGVIDGELVRVRIRKVKKRLVEADLLEVTEPSPHRVVAPCSLFLSCGGCNYQHIDYTHQLRIKENQIREALRRLGGVGDPPVRAMIPSPEHYAYRNRITVHVRDGVLGFFAAGSNRVVSVDQCLIASEDVNSGFKDLRDSHPRDDDYLIGEKKRYGGFRQVNNSLGEILKEVVASALLPEDEARELLVDAYCGAGFFSHQLQSLFGRVIGIERSVASVAMARRQAEPNEEYLDGSVEDMLHAALSKGESKGTTLILDPPSEGLTEKVVESIMERSPARVVYVSCNPATLSRDAKRLSQLYMIDHVTPLDMFPQTAEIESVSLFKLHS